MNKQVNYLAVLVLLGGLSLVAAPPARAQDDMKAASKINKQRNKPVPKLTSPELQAYATRRLLRQDEQTVGQLFDRANDRK